MEKKKKYKDLSKNIILFTISSFGQKILAFLLVPLYTSVLSTGEYGTVDLVSTTVSLLLPMFTVNISEGVMRFTLENKKDKDYLGCGAKITCIGAVILLVVMLGISMTPILKNYHYLFPWLYFIFLINAIYNLQQNYLRAVDCIPIMVTASLVNSGVMMGLNVLLLTVFRLGITGYFISLFMGLFIAVIFMEVRIKFHRKICLDIVDKKIQTEIVKYCIPTVFTALAWWINSSLDRYFVTAICGVDQNGIYSIAYKIPTILGIFQNIFVQAWTLSAITEFDENDTDGFFGNTYEIYNSMMVLICSGIVLFNILLSKILYSNEFFNAWHSVPLLVLSSLFSALSGYLGSIFSAVKDTKTCAISTIVSALVNSGMNFILIKKYGIVGAAIATVSAYIVAWLIRMIVSRRYINMKISLVRETITYVLLFIQVIFAMSESHYYIAQILIIMLIVLVNIKFYKSAFKQLINKYLGVKK